MMTMQPTNSHRQSTERGRALHGLKIGAPPDNCLSFQVRRKASFTADSQLSDEM
ncbi:hypothetical protein J6590_017133 [Homalodisca vitripennis]|nr:hypothetical protein J6590_017133 [Homalodisca vitripennis]